MLVPVLVTAGFPVGMALYTFCGWISRQKTDLRQRRAVADGWRYIVRFGIGLSLGRLLLEMTGHSRWTGLPSLPIRELAEIGGYLGIYWGASYSSRMQQRRKSGT